MSQNPSVPAPSPKAKVPKGAPGAAPPPEEPVDQQPEQLDEDAGSGLPPWVDAAFPWMVSLTFHLGILLLGIFAIVVYAQKKTDDGREAIVIPSSFEDPSVADKPGGIPHPGAGDPTRDAAQDMKKVLKSDGFAQSESKDNVANLLQGQSADNDAMLISLGTGGSVGKGSGGSGGGNSGVLAPYGTPGGGDGAGPKSNFYGNGGNGRKIVYILDHSGSMLDNFDFLRQEAIKSVQGMIPVQQFDVVMVSEQAEAIFPTLRRATPQTKRDFDAAISKFRAQGQNDDLLAPFQEAFEKAFATKPDLIYFLTDGHFDPRLTEVVNKLNRDHKVHINTLAFINEEKSYAVQLQEMAHSNGGAYKFVSERDLGR